MRNLPVDSDRFEAIVSGVTPVPVFVELPDGSRRPDPNGRQAVDEEHGRGLLWTVDVLVQDGERSEVVGVQVPAPQQPVLNRLAPARFPGLAVRVSKGRDGNVKTYFSADTVEQSGNGHGVPARAGKQDGES